MIYFLLGRSLKRESQDFLETKDLLVRNSGLRVRLSRRKTIKNTLRNSSYVRKRIITEK